GANSGQNRNEPGHIDSDHAPEQSPTNVDGDPQGRIDEQGRQPGAERGAHGPGQVQQQSRVTRLGQVLAEANLEPRRAAVKIGILVANAEQVSYGDLEERLKRDCPDDCGNDDQQI